MATILKIGYTHYLVRRASDAAAVVKALADAMEVDCSYVRHQRYFYPREDHSGGDIGMFTVPDKSVLPSKPDESIEMDSQVQPVPPAPLKINGRGPLLLKGGER